jgi:Domain of unknown function (DUF4352)
VQNTPQGNLPGGQAPVRAGLKKWYWVGGAVLVLVLCGACAGIASTAGRSGLSDQRTQITTGQGTSSQATAAQPAAQRTQAPASTATPKASVAEVGQTQTWDGVQVTVTAAAPLQPGQYDSIKAGDEYLVAHVKIVNTSDKSYDYNEYDFQVMSKAGNVTHTTFTISYTANDELHSGTLTAGGGTVEGDLVFEVTQADHVAAVIWQPNVFSSDVYGWKVTF